MKNPPTDKQKLRKLKRQLNTLPFGYKVRLREPDSDSDFAAFQLRASVFTRDEIISIETATNSKLCWIESEEVVGYQPDVWATFEWVEKP